jgi:hypothetical protein
MTLLNEGILEVHTLNPEVRTRWVMRRLEIVADREREARAADRSGK